MQYKKHSKKGLMTFFAVFEMSLRARLQNCHLAPNLEIIDVEASNAF
jgi:hypothetical protein